MSGKTRYAPVKMPFVIEAEATATEYAAAVEYDHDPDVHEFYSQVEALQIEYQPEGGKRRIRIHTTPDFFCIRVDCFVFVECKTEEELITLAKKSPSRYQRDGSGRWRSPPGEAAAAEFGCIFEVRSTKSNNWTLIENLELLKDYAVALAPRYAEAKATITARLAQVGWISVFDLVHLEPAVPADALYSLIACREVFFPLSTQRLADQEHAFVFRDELTHRAHGAFVSASSGKRSTDSGVIEIEAGSLFTWDDKPWRIVNKGNTRLSIQSLDGAGGGSNVAEISQSDFLELVRLGRVHSSPQGGLANSDEGEELLRRASPKDLEEAQRRYIAIQRFGSGERKNLTIPLRTLFHWQRKYREAEERYGNGFIGLLPRRRGNRRPKASLAAIHLAETIIATDWESIRHKKRLASYGRYANEACREGISAISYASFCKRIKKRSGFQQHARRFGEGAAYDQEPQYLELEYTTPRHGVRPWHIAHIDHTPLPLKFVHSRFRSIERTIWLTVLIDAFSRKVLAYYLSFDEPSYRSCMMVLRDCVRRHNRVPQIIVCDRGPEFSSIYWETQLAFVRASKRDRRARRPREGSVCERIFNTTQSQFIKSLLGATDIVEQYFRRVSPEIRPERHAVWTLDQFDVGFQRYLDEIYHVNSHGGIGMSPNEAWALGIKSHGVRAQAAIPYDSRFLIQSCPAVHRGQAKVSPAGIKVNYRWFKCEALSRRGVLGSLVPARYDPFNAGVAYVYVQQEWHECRSELHAVFSRHTERQVRLQTEHLRLMDQIAGRNLRVNAQRLAAFLESLEEEEAEQAQLRADGEAAAHRRKINTPQVRPSNETGEAKYAEGHARDVVGKMLEDL
jgi:transposase InsO family protein